MRPLLLLLALVAVASGCKSSDSSTGNDRPEAPVSGEPLGATPAENDGSGAEALGQPTIEVDGKEVQVGVIGENVELLSLQGLPAIDEWHTVVARSQDGREFLGGQPKLLTGARTMRLVKLPTGYEFQIVESKDTGPYVRHRMSELKRIIIVTKGYRPPALPVPVLSIKLGNGPQQVLSAGLLDDAPHSPEPDQKEARDTWSLTDVLDLAGGRAMTGVITLSNAGGQTLVLSGTDLFDPAWSHIIKRNRRGEFHYRGWKLGESPTREKELRGLSLIEML